MLKAENWNVQLLEHTAKANQTIISTSTKNLDLIPHIDLVATEIELVDKKIGNIC